MNKKIINDLTAGRREQTSETETAGKAKWTSEAENTAKTESALKKRSNFKACIELLRLVRPLSFFMICAILTGVLGFICAALIPALGVASALNIAGRYAVNTPLSFILICAGMAAVLRGIFHYIEQTCNHYIAFTLLAIIRGKVFAALRRLCPAKLEGRGKGNLISLITSDIELLEVFFAHTISPVAIAFIFCVLMCAFLATFSWLYCVAALFAYLALGVLLPFVVSSLCGENGDVLRSKAGELSSFVLESLRGLFELNQFKCGKKRVETLEEKTDDLIQVDLKLKNRAGTSRSLATALVLFFEGVFLLCASLLFMAGKVECAEVLVPFVAFISSFGPVLALSSLGTTLQNTLGAAKRVLDILKEKAETEELSGFEEIEFNGAELENVDFSYKTDGEEKNQKILEKVNVSFEKGKITGIEGKSGSGKSTMLKLLMRFWQADGGKVKIGLTDVNRINTANLRRMESYVTQQTELFHDSIENNIKIAKLDARRDEVIQACKKACVHDFIMSLPCGYETQVGELGDTLSSGEKQRLGVARAFLHDSPFVLLDEPTSNLDTLNEAEILKSVHDECKNNASKTVVLVSHRKSTLKIADKIFKMKNGRLC